MTSAASSPTEDCQRIRAPSSECIVQVWSLGEAVGVAKHRIIRGGPKNLLNDMSYLDMHASVIGAGALPPPKMATQFRRDDRAHRKYTGARTICRHGQWQDGRGQSVFDKLEHHAG